MRHEIPYEKVSAIYDKILNHVEYSDWAHHILTIAEYHDADVNSLIDLACGTGSFLHAFPGEHIKKVGIELASGMVDIANKKLNGNAKIYQGDIRTFKMDESFDLATCLLDSINYLDSLSDLQKVLDRVYSTLNQNGIFIFDAVSQKACKEHFFNYTEKDMIDDVEYERYCHYDVFENIQYSEFTLKMNSETYYEKHVQHIFDFGDIKSEIKKSNFKLLATYGDFELRPIDRYSERAHFVLGK